MEKGQTMQTHTAILPQLVCLFINHTIILSISNPSVYNCSSSSCSEWVCHRTSPCIIKTGSQNNKNNRPNNKSKPHQPFNRHIRSWKLIIILDFLVWHFFSIPFVNNKINQSFLLLTNWSFCLFFYKYVSLTLSLLSLIF